MRYTYIFSEVLNKRKDRTDKINKTRQKCYKPRHINVCGGFWMGRQSSVIRDYWDAKAV
ncbi:hypothetical protein J8TS2_24220 [Lederbergia ruris]|uniref:Uncharacterized protein n=1 Tax=Lederbergia ruris TaxID=217495 RepID=A0ABQ4KJG2_9BACI|nr:hypothetical protein J8TS2_24220 [Lederbergia ruris]